MLIIGILPSLHGIGNAVHYMEGRLASLPLDSEDGWGGTACVSPFIFPTALEIDHRRNTISVLPRLAWMIFPQPGPAV